MAGPLDRTREVHVPATPIFTIGYGARSMEAFLQVLRDRGVAYLIDVRSKPYSRFKPEFSKESLQAALHEAGIRYVYMGDVLGGMPADRSVYDEDGKVVYERVQATSAYQSGIARLATASAQGLSVAIMCSEGKPEMCHRSKLIGRTLQMRAIDVAHIDEHDQVVSQDAVMLRLMGGQMSLFPDQDMGLKSRKSYTPEEGEDELEEE